MKRKLLLLALATLGLERAQGQTVRAMLLDFGVNDVTNGNSTPSPDANGNYWNNILNNTAVADTFRLVDKQGVATGAKVKVGANFLTNGIATGGLLSPSAALLGEYAIATATQDYFFVQGTGSTATGTLRFSGLDASKRYVFHLFGSRQATAETRVSQYRFTGTTVSTVSQTTTGPNVGANGYAGNNNTITNSDTLTADAAGGITLELSKLTGSYAYLNLLRMDMVPGRSTTTPPVFTTFQNPGFELGGLAYWTTVGGSTGGAAVGQTPRHGGTYAARLTGATGLSLEQKISYQAQAGVGTYRLNGFFLNPGTGGLSGTQAARLELLFYNAANALLGRFKSDSVRATTPTDTWVRLSAVGAVPAGTAFVKAAAVWRNSAGTATGSVYFDDLALEPYVPINSNKLTYIGSSVPFGVGATNNFGYTSIYAALLAARNVAGSGGPWVTANVCVPGNNTVDVTNRFDNDIFPQNGKYVFIGLSLGNEGIITGGQPIFDRFRDNMQALLKHARANGLVPIVAGNYGRNDYTATEYGYVQRINALLNGWAVPTVNLLGAVDDLSGNGRYTAGYWWDALHPNDLGHAEMAHAIVPSLLDALAAAKAQPRRRLSTGITLRNTATIPAPTVRLVPEDVVHPFTTALRFRTAGTGRLLEVQVGDSSGLSVGSVQVAANGRLLYTSAKGRTIAGTKVVNDNRWHKLVLTHYYGRGLTRLYVDSLYEGAANERLRLTRLDLGGSAAPAQVQLRDFFFYRSGMNEGEIQTMAADSLLKSSLEIYAPLDGSRAVASDSLTNLAQSLNTLSRRATPLAARESARAAAISLYPNPSTGEVTLHATRSLDGTPVQLYDALGRAVLMTTVRQGRLDVGALPPGVYSLQFQLDGETVRKRLVRQAD